MNKLSFPFLPVLSLILIGGCTGRQARLPIKIGLLADSQITSPNSTPECVYRNKDMDERLEATIRPPALEYLAPEVLKIALDKLSADNDEGERVDLILYLGDGANSGGEDEIGWLFEVLMEHRDKTKIPMFMVIGNHDYLGAGNTPNEAERLLLLNRLTADEAPPVRYNRPLSKYEVLQRISDFNRDPDYLSPNTRFEYVDNRDSLDESLDHGTGLYLAGHLVYPSNGEDRVEIFLADTSDYQSLRFKPEVLKLAVHGWYGSISSKDRSGRKKPSQIDCFFEKRWAIQSPDFRLVASHFHPDNLDRARISHIPEDICFEFENFVHGIYETVCGLFGGRHTNRYLNRWLSGSRNNYWLSGHTHRKRMSSPSQGKVHVGGILEILTDASFRSVNIGSTTDHRAHVVIVEQYVRGKNTRVDRHVGYREIPVFDLNECLLRDILAGISEFADAKRRSQDFQNHDPNFHELEDIDNEEFGASIIGVNKQYQKDYWLQKHTEASVKYLEEFIEWFSSQHPEYDRANIVTCLAFIAGANEKGERVRHAL
ncbi:MAG: metallophosphoesterase [Phycisphaerales bacterium]|nr:MAG: metallophosphoesterase [Phycisphaerales bacterium]